MPEPSPLPTLKTPLGHVTAWWLRLPCACGRTALVPCRVLATELGASLTLGRMLQLLRCRQCGAKPARATLVDDAAGGAAGRVGPIGAQVELLG